MASINAQPKQVTLKLYCGDKFYRHIQYLDGDENPIDLTGATITSSIKTSTGSVSVTVTDRDDENGEFALMLLPADTQDITDQKGVWDLEIQFSSTDIKTIAAGQVQFMRDVS